MTLQSPEWLWALLALPVLAAGLLAWSRSRAEAARRWADPRLLPLGPPPGGRALRAGAAALALLAVAAGVLALTRPSVSAAEERDRSSVMIAFDVSNSMLYKDVAPTRLEGAAQTVRAVLDEAPEGTAAGVVTFADSARVELPPTEDLDRVRATIERIIREPTREGTVLGEAVVASIGALRAAGALDPPPRSAEESPARILLITDGADSIRRAIRPQEAARRAAAERVPIYPVMLGDAPVHEGQIPAPETLALMASTSGGVFAQGRTAEDLGSVFADIGSVVTPVEDLRELTVWPAGAALLLVLGAGALLGLARPPAGPEGAARAGARRG